MTYLVTGEALIDFLGQNNGSTFVGLNGGSSYNVAVGLARLDQEASYFTGISKDMFGKRLKQALVDEGVSPEALCLKDEPSTLAFVTMDDQGVPSYAFYGDGAADRSLTLENWASVASSQNEKTRFVHFGSYSLVAPPTSETLISVAKQFSNRFINLDPNIRPTIQPDMQVWRDAIDAYIPFTSSIKISTEDLEAIYPDQDFKTLAEKWINQGIKLVCVTDGEKGAYAFTKNAHAFTQAPEVDLIDTVGAGDTFSASLLYYLGQKENPKEFIERADGDELEKMLTFCVKAAAITCSRSGADLPRLAEIK